MRKTFTLLCAMLLSVSIFAQNPAWLQSGDEWDAGTGTLTVNSNPESYSSHSDILHLVIADGVTEIGSPVFNSCANIIDIIIPATVTSIGADAFYGCTSVADVYCYANPENLTWNEDGCDDFKQADHATTCHVMNSYLSTYISKWGNTSYQGGPGVNVTFVGDLPDPSLVDPEPATLDPVTWNSEDMKDLDLREYTHMWSSYQGKYIDYNDGEKVAERKDVVATISGSADGAYAQFSTFDNNTTISLSDGGTLTFSSASGQFVNIVINFGETENGYVNEPSDWEFNASQRTVTWSGNATNSIVLESAYIENITSIVFTFAAEEPAPVDPEPAGTTITWNAEDLETVHVGMGNSQTIETITVTNAANYAAGQYCHFLYDYGYCSFSMNNGGTLVFAPESGTLTRIVITCDLYYPTDDKIFTSGWSWDGENQLVWTGNAESVVLGGDGTSTDFASGPISSIVFTVVPAAPEPTEIATIHFAEIYHYEITEFTHTDSDCGHRNGLSMPAFNVWLENENGQAIIDVMPLTVTSSNENVVTVSLGDYYGPTDPDRLISCQPTGYGTATITATFAGNETYLPTQASFTYKFKRNETSMAECALVDKNGDPVTSIVATEGDLIDAPHLARVDGEDLCYTYLAMATTTNRSRWRRNPSTNYWDYFYPMKTGLDTIVFTYYRESSFDSRETEDYKYWDQGVEVRIPVVIMPYITPMISDAETVMNLNPEGNKSMSFGKTENDTYNSAEGQLEIKSVVSAENLQLALDSMARGTKDWNDLLPGATTFNVNPGKGKIKIECKTVAGYELKVLVANQGTATISQVDMDVAEISYNVNQVTTVLVYLAATTGSPAPQRRAPQAKLDEPNAIIKSIMVSPQFDIEAKEDPDNAGLYYSTFFNSTQKYALPNDGTKAFVAKINGSDMVMTPIAEKDEIIPANTAVILQSPTGSFSLTPSEGSEVTFTPSDNQLHGVDEATAAPANCYVLSGHSTDNSVTGVGFYEFSGTIPAHKAYLTVSGGAAYAPKKLRFVFNNEQQTTGIDNAAEALKSEKRIENGQLVIIKNGVRYNAQGQIVK